MRGAVFFALVAGLAVGAFFGGRGLVGLADPQPPPPPPSSRDIINPGGVARDPGPYFEGFVNGIRIVPVGKAQPSDGYCPITGPEDSARWLAAPYRTALGTVWEINPTYLPPGAAEYGQGLVPDPHGPNDLTPVAICDGKIAFSVRLFRCQGTDVNDCSWTELMVQKVASRSIEHDVSAARISTATLGPKPAVLIAPSPTDDLVLDARVIIPEDFGQTIVSGVGVPFEELIKVAEGLR